MKTILSAFPLLLIGVTIDLGSLILSPITASESAQIHFVQIEDSWNAP